MQRSSSSLKLALIASAVTMLGVVTYARAQDVAPVAPPAQQAVTTHSVAMTASLPNFRAIVEHAGPAVVNISTEGTVTRSGRRGAPAPFSPFGEMDPSDPMYDFFRHFGPQFRIPEQVVPRRGVGSGFIVGADGIILTNAHVVADADKVTVKLADQREFEAKVIGMDRPTDIAVLKIEADKLPVARIGSPDSVQPGDWVVAIGAPFGFENSITAGIVSAKSRSLPDEGYVPFIQTDVAVNPGNSGGPLLNLAGEVVGINSQIYSRSGGYQGLSFAIPIDVADNIRDQLVSTGKVTRGRLGVMIQRVDQDLADAFGLKNSQGALVARVDADSPAAKAGIEAGDIILSLNGQAVNASDELPARVAAIKPGEKATLQVWRKGETRTVEATIAAFETDDAGNQTAAAEPGKAGRLGVAVRPMNPAEQQRSDVKGVVVQEANGAAARAGLAAGDLILAVNGKDVTSPDELRAAISAAGRTAALLIERNGQRLFVPVQLGE